MYIVEVIPILRNQNLGTLTYFSSTKPNKGVLCTIPLRKKEVPALVLDYKKASNLKAQIKRSDFKLKKILGFQENKIFTKEFINTLKDASLYFSQNFGSLLFALVPQDILTSNKLPEIQKRSTDENETYVFGFEGDSSFIRDKSYNLLENEISKGRSAILIYPTISQAKETFGELSKKYKGVYLFHGSQKRAENIKTWKKLASHEEPVICVGTIQSLSIPRNDVGLIVMNHESSGLYYPSGKPFFNTNKLLEFYAKNSEGLLVYTDLLLSSSIHYRDDIKIYKSRPRLKTRIEVLELSSENERESRTDNNAIIDEKLAQKLKKYGDTSFKEKVFVLSSRKGFSKTTLCMDCGNIVRCSSCGSPTVLHDSRRTDDKKYFMCHACGKKERANVLCDICGSWNLKPYGTGIEKVEEIISKIAAKNRIFKIDSDISKNTDESEELVQSWQESGGILLGTYVALPFIKNCDTSVLISLDAALSAPSVSATESVFKLLLHLKALSKKSLIIQTRNHSDLAMLEQIKTEDIEDFIKDELDARKRFEYPPYKTVIKISTRLKHANNLTKFVESLEKQESCHIFTSPKTSTKSILSKVAIIKFDKDRWPNKEVSKKLRELPPYFRVEVNPENIL